MLGSYPLLFSIIFVIIKEYQNNFEGNNFSYFGTALTKKKRKNDNKLELNVEFHKFGIRLKPLGASK